MSDTPRTDAETKEGWNGDAAAVSPEFAQGLERELSSLTAEVQRYREALQGWVTSCDSCNGRGALVFSGESAGKSPDRIDCAGCAPFRAILAESKTDQKPYTPHET